MRHSRGNTSCQALMLVLLAPGIWLVPSEAFAQRTIAVAVEPSCSGCGIELRPVVSLVGSDSIGVALSRDSRAVVHGTGYLVTPTYEPGQIAVFDQTGRFLRGFGRLGQGPGGMSGFSQKVRVGPGDSVHVLDRGQWNLFTPSYEYVRSQVLPGNPFDATVTPGNLLAISYVPNRTGDVRGPIQILDVERNTDRWLDTQTFRNEMSVEGVRHLAATSEAIGACAATATRSAASRSRIRALSDGPGKAAGCIRGPI